MSSVLAVGLGSVLWAQSVVLAASMESPAYEPWTERRASPPELPLRERRPQPLGEEPEQARRVFELVPDFGVALPTCGPSEGACATLLGGPELGLTALHRSAPSFAFGLTASGSVFSLTSRAAPDALRSSMLFFGAVGRVYFQESGVFDPYLELAVGGGSLALRTQAGSRGLEDEAAFMPGARVGVGLDVALNPWLRIGPALSLSRYWVSGATRCSQSGCNRVVPDRVEMPRGATSFGLRFTLAAGERL